MEASTLPLAPHQRVMVIPELFVDATKPHNASEALMLACLEGFWAQAQSDSRMSSWPRMLIGILPYAACAHGASLKQLLMLIHLNKSALTPGTGIHGAASRYRGRTHT